MESGRCPPTKEWVHARWWNQNKNSSNLLRDLAVLPSLASSGTTNTLTPMLYWLMLFHFLFFFFFCLKIFLLMYISSFVPSSLSPPSHPTGTFHHFIPSSVKLLWEILFGSSLLLAKLRLAPSPHTHCILPHKPTLLFHCIYNETIIGSSL